MKNDEALAVRTMLDAHGDEMVSGIEHLLRTDVEETIINFKVHLQMRKGCRMLIEQRDDLSAIHRHPLRDMSVQHRR